MANPRSWILLIILINVAFTLLMATSVRASDGVDTNMGDLPKGHSSASSVHSSLVQQVVGSRNRASESLLYSYKRSFNGFVAKLTEEEMNIIADMEDVVSIFPSRKKQLHTTRSWSFMGFPENVKRSSRSQENDVIVGMLDTGIWPESKSFSDDYLGPPPPKWKGTCQTSPNFTCNKKIIGARYYNKGAGGSPSDSKSPRDTAGHGTHTASTVAGGLVKYASLLGLGSGTARGAVPSARLAIYKICWSDGCSDADILAAFDDAIADGVDVISLSIGAIFPMYYFHDSIAIGAFHAMKNGILTSNSAGNNGPTPGSITNISPWSLSVAASVIDRKFVTKVKLGNNKVYKGVAVNTFKLKKDKYPLVYAGDVPNTKGGYDGSTSRYCNLDSLDISKVNGTIVLCDGKTDGQATLSAGAIGIIMQGGVDSDFASSFPLPASFIGLPDGIQLLNYINSTSEPTGTIMRSSEVKDAFAPYVASFSARGPNQVTTEILKPDLAAPGVDIVAAWSERNSVTGVKGDTRVVPYNIISGTSMSCPHATGAAAYVKSFHPSWSPAAIKSALMTTANPQRVKRNTDAEFAYGAGHINPIKATEPGLVYDAGEADYIAFLCGQGYSNRKLRLIAGGNSSSRCTRDNNATVWDLNYPSFAMSVTKGKWVRRVFHRTVTNVGFPVTTYKANVTAPEGVKIKVKPNALKFKSVGQKQKFFVRVKAKIMNYVASGSLVWDDGLHQVRSPILVFCSSS